MLGLEVGINKLLGVEKKRISETPGRKIDAWGRGIILVIFLTTLFFSNKQNIDLFEMKWFWLGYFILLYGFQVFVEWKYIKNSKQYLASFIMLISSVVLLILAFNFI